MRRSLRHFFFVVAALVGLSCRHAPPPAPLPDDWSTLVVPVGSFAGLYRLACCGHGPLLATVRGGDGRLALSIVAPPGAKVADAWVEGENGTVAWPGRTCRDRLPPGRLPLGDNAWLPLDAELASMLLAGRLPTGLQPLGASPGWLRRETPNTIVELQVVGAPTRCVGLRLLQGGQDEVLMEALMTDHHGPVPGRIMIVTGKTTVSLTLVSWQGSAAPHPPPYLQLPICGETP